MWRLRLLGLAFMVLLAAGGVAFTQESVVRPSQHFRVERPAFIDGQEALAIYEQVVDAMVDAYTLSDDPVARDYRSWTRYSRTPYESATHGSRYVNNYANRTASAYGDYEQAGTLAVGSILAKDAFTVTADGAVFPGPLAIMEKMEAGFNLASRDWRYSEIMPDGSLVGMTNGFNSEGVAFCITCHETAGDEQDHLFFLPEENRRRAPLKRL